MDHSQIEQAIQFVQNAHSIVVLTGAGISTPSGVPDFRGEHGIWQDQDPFEVAALAAFQRDPQRFYTWFRPLLKRLLAAKPNPAHRALAQLEHIGRVQAIVTQNIDGLHQAAGSQEVYELHGHLRTATCLGCDSQIAATKLVQAIEHGSVLRCICGAPFKPDVVLFDEILPRGLFWLAQRAIDQADLLLIAGTSLEVSPVCEMPLNALKRGAKVVLINHSTTYLDEYADLVLHEDLAQVLPAIVERVTR
jgi:NAD-dependent deacetylase